MLGKYGLIASAAAVVSTAAAGAPLPETRRAELGFALLDHGTRKPFRTAPPPGFDLYEGEKERGSVDMQLLYRTPPMAFALKPRLTARLQVNTAGGTNFASLGAEWRQHVLHGRVYGQIGIGLAIHDGYRFTPDPRAPGLTLAETLRRIEIDATRTSFGSRVLFNPNLSLGLRLSERVAVEAAFEHFSHATLFSAQNPGINNLGLRLMVALGK